MHFARTTIRSASRTITLGPCTNDSRDYSLSITCIAVFLCCKCNWPVTYAFSSQRSKNLCGRSHRCRLRRYRSHRTVIYIVSNRCTQSSMYIRTYCSFHCNNRAAIQSHQHDNHNYWCVISANCFQYSACNMDNSFNITL